jgi:ribonuclease HI
MDRSSEQTADMTTPWLAHVDGTAVPSPGALGVGVVLVAPDGVRHEVARALDARGCNNEAEARAVVVALDEAARLGARALRLHSDSLVVVDELGGRRHTQVARLRAVFDEVAARRAGFDVVEVVLVGRRDNGDADRLARAALGLGPKVTRSRWRRDRRR